MPNSIQKVMDEMEKLKRLVNAGDALPGTINHFLDYWKGLLQAETEQRVFTIDHEAWPYSDYTATLPENAVGVGGRIRITVVRDVDNSIISTYGKIAFSKNGSGSHFIDFDMPKEVAKFVLGIQE